ncbi:MAG: type II toxin-antitoxin system HicB family antitoxin [Nanoarchaeota archaeon]
MKKYTIIVEKDDEGNYVGYVPELQGCYTEGSTLDELLKNMKEVISVWVEIDKDLSPLEFVGVQTIEV